MGWPARIIIERENVSRINFKAWGAAFFSLLLIYIVCFYFFKLLTPDLQTKLLTLFFPFAVISMILFTLIFIARVYFFGVMLANHEAYTEESKRLQDKWTLWANKKTYIAACKVFTPQNVDIPSVIADGSPEVYIGQVLRFKDFSNEDLTEEYFYDELLSSIHEEISRLLPDYFFEAVFIKPEDAMSFSVFKDCWQTAGFPEEKITKWRFFTGDYSEVINSCVDNAEPKVIQVIIFIGAFQERSKGSEFASIFLLSHDDINTQGVIYRPLSTVVSDLTINVKKMMKYQSVIYTTGEVRFSGMPVEEQAMIDNTLRATAMEEHKNWSCAFQDLNMIFGEQGANHSWLTLAFTLTAASLSKQKQLMVVKDSGKYFFNVIGHHLENSDGEPDHA
ncbi:TPA: hypothetical protein U2I12_000469 [Citrobacter farmeri]|nr:hypothetical protein [Citrobacter farmeri]